MRYYYLKLISLLGLLQIRSGAWKLINGFIKLIENSFWYQVVAYLPVKITYLFEPWHFS